MFTPTFTWFMNAWYFKHDFNLPFFILTISKEEENLDSSS